MGGLIEQLSGRVIEERDMEPDDSMELESRIAMTEPFSTDSDSEALGPPSGYVCPDCSDSLAEIFVGSYRWLLRRGQEMESALWFAVRSLQEKAKLSRYLAKQTGPGLIADRYSTIADEAEHALSVLDERLSAASRQSEDRGG